MTGNISSLKSSEALKSLQSFFHEQPYHKRPLPPILYTWGEFMTKKEVLDEVIEILIKRALEEKTINSRGEKENGVYSSSGYGK